MRKSIIILIALLTLGSFGANAQTIKLGHVNSMAVMDSIPSYKRLLAYSKEEEKLFQEQAAILGKKIETKEAEIQAAYKNPAMTETDIEFLDIDYQSLIAKAQRLQANYEKNMGIVQQRGNLIFEKFSEILKDIAEKQGYSYVFESESQVLFASKNSKDLTAEVRKALIAYDIANPFYKV